MMDLAEWAAAALERSVLLSVIARGAGMRVVAVEDGIARLEVTGSPGAVFPLGQRRMMRPVPGRASPIRAAGT